jgi:hypothetical protein
LRVIRHATRYEISRKFTLLTLPGSKDYSLTYNTSRTKRTLDIAELDTETTDLNLTIDSPKKLQLSILPQSNDVSTAVEGFSWTVRIRKKTFSSHGGLSDISESDTCSTNEKFSGTARRYRAEILIDHRYVSPTYRTTNRNHSVRPRGKVCESGVRRRFAGPVEVDKPDTGIVPMDIVNKVGRERLTSYVYDFEAARQLSFLQKSRHRGRNSIKERSVGRKLRSVRELKNVTEDVYAATVCQRCE